MGTAPGDQVLMARVSPDTPGRFVWFRRSPLLVRNGAFVCYPTVRASRIPVAEVTGVGLVLTYLKQQSDRYYAWVLTLWDRDGQALTLDGTWLKAQALGPYGEGRPHESSEQLGASEVGRAASAAYDVAMSVQGATGPLATRRAQRFTQQDVWHRRQSFFAYWSPDDGEMGSKPSVS